ncbi:MAG TPA: beta-propeller fold lactonase family protein [Polyangiaceae bacterium]|nr:beta-propeller fold lactonase family protein [Polyangiaceae bacterium]
MSLLPDFEKFLFVVVATIAVACSGSTGPADDAGVSFPNRRSTFEHAGRRLGYVANRNSDTVSVLDLDAMTLLGSVPVGRDPVDIDGPRHIVLDSANALAYVVLSYPFSVPSVHVQGATKRASYVQALNLSDLSIAGEMRVDPWAVELAFSPASGRLAVSHADEARALLADPQQRRANLVLVDQATAIALGSAQPDRLTLCAVPKALSFDAAGSRLFVVCTGEDSIAVVDSESQTVLSRVPASAADVNKPYALVLDASRERLLVSNQVSRTVSVFNLDDTPKLLSAHRTLDENGFPLGIPMFSVFVSDGILAIPFQTPSGAALFDVTTGEQLREVLYSDEECLNPAEFSLTSDSRLRLVCEGDHYKPGQVVEVDPNTLAITASVPVELYPERMSILEP